MSHFRIFFLLILFAGTLLAQENSEELFKKAESYFFQKKYEVAEQNLLKVIELDPGHAKAYSYLGDINLFNRRYNNAIKYYNQAKSVSNRPGYEYFRLGQVYLELKKSDDALNQFQSAYSVDPALKTSLYQIGYIYLMHKRDKLKTIEFWRKFITEAPEDYQYEQVRKAITLLEDSSCVIPPEDSGISMEEVLMNCGNLVKPDFIKTQDNAAGSETEKTNNDTEGLLNDTPDGF